MPDRPEDICPKMESSARRTTEPLVPPISLSAVYRCTSPEQADALLAGAEQGYVYARDAHPNADDLSAKYAALHGAEWCVICGSGMAALSAAVLSELRAGDHVVLSSRLYGRSRTLLVDECTRWNLEATVVDTEDLAAVRKAMRAGTRLILAETISNPSLRVCDIAGLAEIAHRAGAALLIDNTFASPIICRPLELGADLVLESLTKIGSGHSDVVLGVLCGRGDRGARVASTISTWGLTAGAFDCWLARRGVGTLAIRYEAAERNATAAAQMLSQRSEASVVYYPGLASHPEHELAKRQFGGHFGTMVTFTLAGGLAAARAFIAGAKEIPFSPSLGDLATTLSHPVSTSHRGLEPAERRRLGIDDGTIRLSLGIESTETVLRRIEAGLEQVK